MLLSPKPKKKTSADTPKDESYIFSGPENVTEQGVPVPLIYGQPFCGTVVISAGIEVNEIPLPPPVYGLARTAPPPEPEPMPPPGRSVMTSRIWRASVA
jgi:hypothetical protein